MKPGQRRYEEQRAQKAGQKIEDWLVARMPADCRIARIEQFITASDQVDSLMEQAQKVGEGLIRPSRELIAAIERKTKLLNLVRLDRTKAAVSVSSSP